MSKLSRFFVRARDPIRHPGALEIPFLMNGKWTRVFVPIKSSDSTYQPSIEQYSRIPFLVRPKDLGLTYITLTNRLGNKIYCYDEEVPVTHTDSNTVGF